VAVAVTAGAASMAADSRAVGLAEVASTVEGSTVAAFAAVDFAAAGFAAMGSTEIGFTMATSTIGFSSLTTLETRSSIIPIHTMDIIQTATIPTPIIRMATILTATDTVVFGEAASAAVDFAAGAFMGDVDFTAVVFTAVALMAVSLTEMAPESVDDSYNEPIYRGNAWYTETDFRC